MACGSCGARRSSTSNRAAVSSQGVVQGYEYTSPAGEVQVFLTPFEAKKAQRRHGGGTIVTLKKG